jgi:8-oxo-dGTP diphosphatase
MPSIPGRDHIGVGVGALVFNHHGQVFLARRGAEARNEVGMWEFPGGMVHFGERLEEAVRREFEEEYGMHVEVTKLLGVFDDILPAEGQHWVSPTYLARHISGKPTIREPQKCLEIGWFGLQALPHNLSSISKQNLAAYFSTQ